MCGQRRHIEPTKGMFLVVRRVNPSFMALCTL